MKWCKEFNLIEIKFSRPEIKDGVSVVRELHVYGSVVPVASRDPSKFQHQGFGTLLMEEAERIAREEHGAHKLAVISGKTSGVFLSDHALLRSLVIELLYQNLIYFGPNFLRKVHL